MDEIKSILSIGMHIPPESIHVCMDQFSIIIRSVIDENQVKPFLNFG